MATECAAYRHLTDRFRASTGQTAEERWQWLMAAHIVGQMDWRSVSAFQPMTLSPDMRLLVAQARASAGASVPVHAADTRR